MGLREIGALGEQYWYIRDSVSSLVDLKLMDDDKLQVLIWGLFAPIQNKFDASAYRPVSQKALREFNLYTRLEKDRLNNNSEV